MKGYLTWMIIVRFRKMLDRNGTPEQKATFDDALETAAHRSDARSNLLRYLKFNNDSQEEK